MKKMIFLSIFIIIFITGYNQIVYAAGTSDGSNENWVSDSFSAASSFLQEKEIEDDIGFINPVLKLFKNMVKAVNMVLLTLLAGLSMISLSITGVRYLASGASPRQKETAKQSLHTIFIGMAIGFGAFAIFEVAMSIIEIIIKNLA